MAQVVSRRLLTAEARVRAQVSPRLIYGGESVIWTGFSPSYSVYAALQYHSTCQHHCTAAPHSLMYHLVGLESQFHRDIVSPHRNSKNPSDSKVKPESVQQLGNETCE
jgi:hypothetical protein